MSGLSRTSDDLSPRRRKILYHAWHRGTRELDLLLGRFADSAIGELTDGELDEFEALLEVDDRELFGWILGKAPVPESASKGVFAKVLAFAQSHPLTG
ncbi:succinate dehydrogenase assembly factor 2 [Pleomorphomonas diazotrophica]|uniref:FAD assembly factor SdhE n=1 Tax=Pleomorphomonas diazotrophica TaxID=1166257 RepID=A0A1I4Q5N4_9HYPH|nr:succinate dehydrogenase assembly factor 2 [Pleomorphomonas diazotrophica]PKR90917.1 succinate dehydrogenase assembly factor 2 [Pleomorphomonas diazotrophica]SFM35379.1 antitoxin CptB [Pleomorphomonas diazotrophica]